MKKEELAKALPIISRLLQYSFKDINWTYSLLTKEEKKLISEKEFTNLKTLLK